MTAPKFGPATTAEEAAQDIDLRGKTAPVTGIKAYALDVANADRMWTFPRSSWVSGSR